MEKTAMQTGIDKMEIYSKTFIDSNQNTDITFCINMFKGLLELEKKQIVDAFNDSIELGDSLYGSEYYSQTFNNEVK